MYKNKSLRARTHTHTDTQRKSSKKNERIILYPSIMIIMMLTSMCITFIWYIIDKMYIGIYTVEHWYICIDYKKRN